MNSLNIFETSSTAGRPSERFSPMFKNIASALKNVIDVGAVNADEQIDLKKRFGIRSYPRIYFFHGRNLTLFTGRRNFDEIVDRGFEELRRKVLRKVEGRNSRNVKDEGMCSD